MVNESALVFVGVAPHPPIMVPEVGGEAIESVRRSIRAMAELTERILNTHAETLVLVSPHAPLEPDQFVAYNSPVLHGDFQRFHAADTKVEAELDRELLEAITQFATQDHLGIQLVDGSDLDHGTSVPLYFLQHNGWAGKVVAMGYSYLSNAQHLQFG